MFVEFVHDVWSAVHDRVGLIFGVFADAIAGKATNLTFVSGVCGLVYINVFLNG